MSGLLTVFRTVVGLALEEDLVELPVAADLGYSWRPDKPWFRSGDGEHLAAHSPAWLDVTDAVPLRGWPTDPGEELVSIRTEVAHTDDLGPGELDRLRRRMAPVAEAYRQHFTRWFDEHEIDWVCAVNMTLSDAVPVTIGLHAAARDRWGQRGARPGGILFWDHDLFGTYAVRERGERIYPLAPNPLTPLPGTDRSHRWAVVSDVLADDAASYPTPLRPELVPNVLPAVPPDPRLEERHEAFLRQHGIEPGAPIVLVPVRVFRVKGVEIAVELFAALRSASRRRGEPDPQLLVFGSLDEDPEYATEVLATLDRTGAAGRVRFLDGVPLQSYCDGAGGWRLDEVDLLHITAARGGAVLFTPNTPDVESVGLGPALAAIAGLPCAVTPYIAFESTYGTRFHHVRVPVTGGLDGGLDAAANELLDQMVAVRRAGPGALAWRESNRRAVRERFPTEPWRRLLREMADDISEGRSSMRDVARTTADRG